MADVGQRLNSKPNKILVTSNIDNCLWRPSSNSLYNKIIQPHAMIMPMSVYQTCLSNGQNSFSSDEYGRPDDIINRAFDCK